MYLVPIAKGQQHLIGHACSVVDELFYGPLLDKIMLYAREYTSRMCAVLVKSPLIYKRLRELNDVLYL